VVLVQDHCIEFLGETLEIVPVGLSIQVHKWVLEELMLGVTLQRAGIPSTRKYKVLPVNLCDANWDKLW